MLAKVLMSWEGLFMIIPYSQGGFALQEESEYGKSSSSVLKLEMM